MKLLEAIVEAYGKDEDKGTLSVCLLGMKKEEGTIEQVRVLTSYANQKAGIVVFPEIGDVVLISFLDQGNTQAVCMGTLLPRTCAVLQEAKEDNTLKLLKLVSGFTFLVDETKDKERLCIKSKSNLQFIFDEEAQTVSIGQENKKQYLRVDMKEKKITIQGEDEMSFLCGDAQLVMEKGNITLKGKDIQIKSTSLQVEASSDIELKGVNTTFKASNKMLVHGATSEVSADMKQDIKGAMIQIG